MSDIQERCYKAAFTMLKFWRYEIDQSQGNSWYKLEYRQALRDSLEIMKKNGLIKDYDVENMVIMEVDDE